MSLFASPDRLRTLLWADAGSCLVTGALHLLATAPLATLLGVPESLLVGSGVALCGFVALAAYLAMQSPVPRPLAALLVAGNFAWTGGAIALLFGGALSPTTAGQAYLVVQALAVATLAELQWTALRRQPRGA